MSSILDPEHYFDLSLSTHRDLWKDCQYVWQILDRLESYIRTLDLGRLEGSISPQAYLVHPELISIGPGTVVEPGAYIQGPCYIGKNCQIRHGAYIRGNLLAEDRAVIGHATEVKNAFFFEKAQAGHFAYVGDSILGRHCNLGAGTKCANLKLSGREVLISHEGERVPTGRRKLGAIIGDEAQLGCNTVTNPGTLMAKGARCLPCSTVGGYLPENSVGAQS